MTTPRVTAIVAAISFMTSAGCSTDTEPRTASSPGEASSAGGEGDVSRYCELIAELDALGEQIFADLTEEATAEEVMQREQMVLEQGAAQPDELLDVAPAAIRDDVPVL